MKTKYDWSGVPERIKFLAFDPSCGVRGFVEKPKIRCDFWIDEICPYFFESNMCAPSGNWQDSLEERPNDLH